MPIKIHISMGTLFRLNYGIMTLCQSLKTFGWPDDINLPNPNHNPNQ